jgi:hypothetical protein
MDKEDHSMKPRNVVPVGFPQSGSPDVAAEASSNGNPTAECAREEDAEDVRYDPIPPKKTVTVSVPYRIRGRGQPLPYPLDEADGQ